VHFCFVSCHTLGQTKQKVINWDHQGKDAATWVAGWVGTRMHENGAAVGLLEKSSFVWLRWCCEQNKCITSVVPRMTVINYDTHTIKAGPVARSCI